jgi:hypothetical protein
VAIKQVAWIPSRKATTAPSPHRLLVGSRRSANNLEVRGYLNSRHSPVPPCRTCPSCPLIPTATRACPPCQPLNRSSTHFHRHRPRHQTTNPVPWRPSRKAAILSDELLGGTRSTKYPSTLVARRAPCQCSLRRQGPSPTVAGERHGSLCAPCKLASRSVIVAMFRANPEAHSILRQPAFPAEFPRYLRHKRARR